MATTPRRTSSSDGVAIDVFGGEKTLQVLAQIEKGLNTVAAAQDVIGRHRPLLEALAGNKKERTETEKTIRSAVRSSKDVAITQLESSAALVESHKSTNKVLSGTSKRLSALAKQTKSNDFDFDPVIQNANDAAKAAEAVADATLKSAQALQSASSYIIEPEIRSTKFQATVKTFALKTGQAVKQAASVIATTSVAAYNGIGKLADTLIVASDKAADLSDNVARIAKNARTVTDAVTGDSQSSRSQSARRSRERSAPRSSRNSDGYDDDVMAYADAVASGTVPSGGRAVRQPSSRKRGGAGGMDSGLSDNIFDQFIQSLEKDLEQAAEKGTKSLVSFKGELKSVNQEADNIVAEGLSEGFQSISANLGSVSTGIPEFNEAIDKTASVFSAASGQLTTNTDELAFTVVKLHDLGKNFQLQNPMVAQWGQSISTASQQLLINSDNMRNLAQSGAATSAVLIASAAATKKLGGALGALSKILGPIAIAAGVLYAALEIANIVTGRSTESINKRINAIKREREQINELNALIREGSQEEVNNRKKQNREERKLLERQLEGLVATAAQNTSILDILLTRVSYGASRLTGLNLEQEFGEAAKAIRETVQQVQVLDTEYENLSQDGLPEAIERARILNDVLSQAGKAIESFADQTDNLNTARIEQARALQTLQASLRDKQDEFDQETLQLQESRQKEEMGELRSHLESLESEQKRYQESIRNERLTHLRDLKALEEDYAENRKQAEIEQAESLADMEKDFQLSQMESALAFQEQEIESRAEYDKTIIKMEEDFQKQRIQRQKDLAEQLFEAEMQNDALQYFMLQRQGEKAETEAEEQQREQIAEERKQFDEQRAERQEQFDEGRADQIEQYNEERAQSILNFKETQAEAAKQHRQEIDERKKQFAERMTELAYEFSQEQRQRALDFKKRMDDLKIAQAEQDALRQENLAAERQSLVDGFNQELEYFQKREELLMQYIADIQRIQDRFKGIGVMVSDKSVDLSENNVLAEVLGEQLTKLQMAEENGGMSDTERILYEDATRLMDSLRAGREEGIVVELSNEDQILLTDAINQSKSGLLAYTQTDYNERLEYTPEELATLQEVRAITSAGNNLFDAISGQLSGFLQDQQLITTESGLETNAEREEQAERYAQIQQAEGDQSLETLQDRSEQYNRQIIREGENANNVRRDAEDQELVALDEHFYEQDTSTANFHTNQQELLGTSTRNQLDTQEQGLDGLESGQDVYYGDSQTSQTLANEGLLLDQTTHEDELTDLHAVANENEILTEEQQRLLESETLIAFYALKLSLLQEYVTKSQKVSDKYYADKTSNMNKKYREMQSDTERVISSGNAKLLSMQTSHQSQIYNALQQIASAAANFARQAAVSARSGSSYNANGSGYSSIDKSSSKPSVKSGSSGRTLFSAKGSYHDSPRDVIAGEAMYPEMIMPYEQSTGIPSDVLEVIGRGFYKELSQKNGLMPKTLFAAKGTVVSSPTRLVAGEGSKPEVIIPFDKSQGFTGAVLKGIQDGFLGAHGENKSRKLNTGRQLSNFVGNGTKQSALFSENYQISNAANTKLIRILERLSASGSNSSPNLSIGDIHVGSGVSREDVREQMTGLQGAIIELLKGAVNP